MSEGAFRSERIGYLLRHFDESELEALLELVKTKEGLRAFRKLPAYLESWRQRVAPHFYEALTNAPAE